MPTSLPPLPDEIEDAPTERPDSSGSGPQTASAFGGGMPPVMQELQKVESGLQQLAMLMPSMLPTIAQMISTLRMAVPDAMAAGAGASPSGGPTGPAITGMGQNPTALPAPPQPGM